MCTLLSANKPLYTHYLFILSFNKSVEKKIIFLISQPKHMLLVFKRIQPSQWESSSEHPKQCWPVLQQTIVIYMERDVTSLVQQK